MARVPMVSYTVHVYRPSGIFLTKFLIPCTRPDVAINRAKKRIYRMGMLAHFYSYVPVVPNLSTAD
jgi:hypothetical protein